MVSSKIIVLLKPLTTRGQDALLEQDRFLIFKIAAINREGARKGKHLVPSGLASSFPPGGPSTLMRLEEDRCECSRAASIIRSVHS